nr:MAG TPA: hypothetical protein [Caudoviricetes sp.]
MTHVRASFIFIFSRMSGSTKLLHIYYTRI